MTSVIYQPSGHSSSEGLKSTSASSLHGEHNIGSLVRSGIACSDVGYESSPLLFLALCKGRLDLLHADGDEWVNIKCWDVNWTVEKL
jgi:hypothetical protein